MLFFSALQKKTVLAMAEPLLMQFFQKKNSISNTPLGVLLMQLLRPTRLLL